VRGASAEARRIARQARSHPLIDALKIFFEHQLSRLSGGSDTAEIIRYGLRHWDGLTRFLDDGRIELDTNIVERSMRPHALTRKNALFAGHDDGAENWAILASLIETAKLSGIDPQAWLADILASSISGPTIAWTSSFLGLAPPRTRNSSAPPESLSRFTPLPVNQASIQGVPKQRSPSLNGKRGSVRVLRGPMAIK
jgi:hypothetical protein